jgi:integrase
MFDWALEAEVEDVAENPVRKVKYPKPRPHGGHHTWTDAEIGKFELRHPVGSKAHLALALLLFTGLRASDVVRLGPKHVDGEEITITLYKNRNRAPKTLTLPILPDLRMVLDASTLGAETFLLTEHGKPFSTAKSFGNRFREWCDQAGLPQCTAHGLRKAGATIVAERGGTTDQLKAIFAWSTHKEPDLYTKTANTKRLAADAMPLLSRQRAAKR